MGKRCGCAGTCRCAFKEGRGVKLSGQGSKLEPVLIDIDGAQAYVRGSATETVAVAVSGAGTPDDPYRVSMDRFLGTVRPLTYRFLTPGTYVWDKPAFGTLALVTVAGAGGGGASGGGVNPSLPNTSQYGAGGGHGQEVAVDFLLADLPASTTLTVGVGGSGGPAAVATDLAFAGGAGAPSTFGAAVALGGVAGQPGARGAGDPRSAAGFAQGGSGGMAEPSPYSSGWSSGLDGGAPAGGPRVGGTGAVVTVGVAGVAGGDPTGLRRAMGTGGGGGVGVLLASGVNGGGDGGAGGPAAGGGGGGTGQTLGGNGGRGGDGAVVILIQ